MTFTSAGDVGVGQRRNHEKRRQRHHQGRGGRRLDRPALQFLTEPVEAGTFTPVIDRTYLLSQLPDAISHLHAGHARGKVVITV